MLQKKYLVLFYQKCLYLDIIFRLCKCIYSQNFSLCDYWIKKKLKKSNLFLIFAKKNLGGTLFYWFWSYRVLWLLTNKDSIFQFHSYVVNLYYWKSVFLWLFVCIFTKCLLLLNCCPKFLSNLKRLFRQCDFYSIKEFVILMLLQ